MAKTKIVMSARTKKISHSPASRHLAKRTKGGKSRAKKVMVKC
jgi:hypothetical protein